jgi:two-component system, OmpR family, response regulator ChvI
MLDLSCPPNSTVTVPNRDSLDLRMDPERHACTWKNEPIALTVTDGGGLLKRAHRTPHKVVN